MYADAVARITKSIFPIFYIQPQDRLVGVCGTGFFVDNSGSFLTADHIMSAVPSGSTMYYYGKAPDEICEPAVVIERLASDPAQDLYLGRVARDYLPPIEVSNQPVRPGDSVCLSGYPMAVLANLCHRCRTGRHRRQDIRGLHRAGSMPLGHERRTGIRHRRHRARNGGGESHEDHSRAGRKSDDRAKRHRERR